MTCDKKILMFKKDTIIKFTDGKRYKCIIHDNEIAVFGLLKGTITSYIKVIILSQDVLGYLNSKIEIIK